MSCYSLVQVQLRTLRSCRAAVALELPLAGLAQQSPWPGRAGLWGAGGQDKQPEGAEIVSWAVGRVGGGPGGLPRAITVHYSPQGPGTQSRTLLGSTATLLSYCFF